MGEISEQKEKCKNIIHKWKREEKERKKARGQCLEIKILLKFSR
jgi:hypothetical protein